jgi:hypothetical protein
MMGKVLREKEEKCKGGWRIVQHLGCNFYFFVLLTGVFGILVKKL